MPRVAPLERQFLRALFPESTSLKTQAWITSTNHTPSLTALPCSPFVLPLPRVPPTHPPHVHTLDDCRGFSAASYWYDTMEVQCQEQIRRRGVFPLPHDRRTTAVVSSYAAAPGRYCGIFCPPRTPPSFATRFFRHGVLLWTSLLRPPQHRCTLNTEHPRLLLWHAQVSPQPN